MLVIFNVYKLFIYNWTIGTLFFHNFGGQKTGSVTKWQDIKKILLCVCPVIKVFFSQIYNHVNNAFGSKIPYSFQCMYLEEVVEPGKIRQEDPGNSSKKKRSQGNG